MHENDYEKVTLSFVTLTLQLEIDLDIDRSMAMAMAKLAFGKETCVRLNRELILLIFLVLVRS